MEPLVTEENESIVMAFAPDIGGLFSAQPEALVKASGCSLDEAKALVAQLHAELTSQ